MSWEGLNRRHFPRAQFPCLVKVITGGGLTDMILTHTENISVGGVCVILKSGLARFMFVDLELDLMDGGDLISCRGKVMWAVRRKAGEDLKPAHYDTGIEFIALSESDRRRVDGVVEMLAKPEQKVKL